jgi:4-alpha-glucanotransferase
MKGRASGILLHLTSLPGRFGIGDLGPTSRQFIDFLAEAGQSYWQILPLNPTLPIHCNSPYASTSAFACNTLLVSPELLAEEGLLDWAELDRADLPLDGPVNYLPVQEVKHKLLRQAHSRFAKRKDDADYRRFCREEESWLNDFALFASLRERFSDRAWTDWPHELRDREKSALQKAADELSERVSYEKFLQYVFFKQWAALKEYCAQRSIQIIGDIPIYVNDDSADVWANPELFKLDDQKRPVYVAGVPPDYFSQTGQRWGNPVYEWEMHRRTGYAWWVRRLAHNMRLTDFVRVDHFRGFLAYWQIAAREKTAVNGTWVEAPAMDFFTQLSRKFSYLPIIAEDLGVITPDVRELMNHFEFPGMRILLFSFGPDMPHNPYIPHNLPRNCVAYTGTHDNNTARGWFESEATDEDKGRLFSYSGRTIEPAQVPREMMRLLMMSAANTVIFPMQDVLGLGSDARMNFPSTTQGNWEWRLTPEQLSEADATWLREMTQVYAR